MSGRVLDQTGILQSLESVHARDFPRRIVCLSDETTETLYLLGAQDRIVGVSGFTTRPPEARKKPKVSAFNKANVDAILQLSPDVVLTFCDVQAEITRELVLRGLTVFNFNQRSIGQIFDMICVLARIVGKQERGLALVEQLKRGLIDVAASALTFNRRPRVFFEEWKDPLIGGIEWVQELIEIAGGELVFPELKKCPKSKDRIVDPAAVVERNPEVIIASWCGRRVNKDEIASRPDWSNIDAVKNGHIYEVKSSFILQPGPAALTEGVRQLRAILARVVGAGPALSIELTCQVSKAIDSIPCRKNSFSPVRSQPFVPPRSCPSNGKNSPPKIFRPP